MSLREYYFKFNNQEHYDFITSLSNITKTNLEANLSSPEFKLTSGNFSAQTQRDLEGIVHEFSQLCLTPKLGLTKLIEYKIRLSDRSVVRLTPYKLPHQKWRS